MEKILFLTHTNDAGNLSKLALESLAAAAALAEGLPDATLDAALIGEEVQAAADAITGCGARQILAVTGADFGVPRYASDVAAATALIEAAQATIVVAPGSSRFCRSLPGAAQRLQGRIDTQVTGLSCDGGELQAQRWYYRQRITATLNRTQRPWVLAMAAGVFAPWEGQAGSASVDSVAVELPDDARRTEVVGVEAASVDAQTIRPEAECLLVAGAGWTKKQADGETRVAEAEQLILSFLNSTGASLGSSKSLVEQSGEGQSVLSFLSHLNQVGQTGSTPRHRKGLATCCHGEEPHVVGWRFISERRAVNLDPNCGWAQGKADVLYVGDAFEVMAELNRLLS